MLAEPHSLKSQARALPYQFHDCCFGKTPQLLQGQVGGLPGVLPSLNEGEFSSRGSLRTGDMQALEFLRVPFRISLISWFLKQVLEHSRYSVNVQALRE